MTREEAVAVLKAFMENPLFSDVHKAAFNIAIHDIKQRHAWDINNLILINKDNYEPLDQEPTTKNNLGVDSTPNTISFKEMTDNLKVTAEDIENAEDLEYSIEPLVHPKNDSAVDCIDRQATLDAIIKRLGIKNETYLLEVERVIYQQILAMPPVTPIRPKGHWIDINYHHYYNDGDIETTELRCSCCNEEVEWDIELLHKPYYCENCGADMREVEE